jgi:2-polyprenyl-6-methoxyphenol hydroxylase-like FAD-dependent oxidoreductase
MSGPAALDTDVAVVGAGPTGLMLANQLARSGVRVLIIDRHSGPAQQTRAIGVQARTLEIYARLGVIDRALALGKRSDGANLWAQGHHTARIPIGDMGKGESPFPFIFMLGQDDNERILGDRLHEFGVSVQWNTELVALEEHADRVVAKLRQPDGSMRTVTTAWLAGCDGSRSTVREACGITFPGAPYEHVFFVADTVATGDMVPDELNVYLWKEGFHLFFPMHGKDHWRVIGILPPELRGRDDLTFDEVVPHVRGEAGARLSFQACSWFSTYRIHHRCASRFRAGHCFLLGDAAHIHSPMGAQGMNTGLQDAYNLAWKLAMVVKGNADAALLDSYEPERMPVARRLLRTTDRAFMLVVKETWLAALFRTQIIARMAAFAMRRSSVRHLFFRTISQIGIRYPDSPLSRTLGGLPEGAPRAGDRFPWLTVRLSGDGPVEDLFEKLDDTRFNLIVIGQPAESASASSVAGSLRVHVVPASADNEAALARVHLTGPAFYLLRPDGHVGLAGTRLDWDAVNTYLASNVRVATTAPMNRASSQRAP